MFVSSLMAMSFAPATTEKRSCMTERLAMVRNFVFKLTVFHKITKSYCSMLKLVLKLPSVLSAWPTTAICE